MLANLSKLASELADSVKPNIHIVGMLAGRERLIALSVSQIFVLPAIGEGLPMAALEAAAAGCALILTEGCNLPETAEIGAGVIVPRTIEGIASALRDLMVDAEKRKAMGERARQWASDNFRWEKIVWQMDHTYGR
jgi:glycosyltransferase involved in cell wall biosynthesis